MARLKPVEIEPDEVLSRLALLHELERCVDRTLNDWYEAGSALHQIRDERLWQGEYRSFKAYCNDRFPRSTAYGLIQAADVKDSLSARADTQRLRLPQRHYQLLHKFDLDNRARIAKLIDPLTYKQADDLVKKEVARLEGEPPKVETMRPKHSVSELQMLDQALRTIKSVSSKPELLSDVAESLRPEDRRRLLLGLRQAIDRLTVIGDTIRIPSKIEPPVTNPPAHRPHPAETGERVTVRRTGSTGDPQTRASRKTTAPPTPS